VHQDWIEALKPHSLGYCYRNKAINRTKYQRGGKMLAGASDVVFVLEINDADGY
jgi:hypothetical protein